MGGLVIFRCDVHRGDRQTRRGKVGCEIGKGSRGQGGDLDPFRPPQRIAWIVRWGREQGEAVVLVVVAGAVVIPRLGEGVGRH
jgi:hypothetical protein